MQHMGTTPSLARAGILLMALGSAPLLANSSQVEAPPEAAQLIDRAVGSELSIGRRTTGQEVWDAVMVSELFVSGSVGPFDVHVLKADGLESRSKAQKLLDDVLETLLPAAEAIGRLWPATDGIDGLISGSRLPIVIADSDGKKQGGFGQLVSFLDYCELLGFSGWYPANQVDTPANRSAETVRTWSVQLFNLAHPTIADRSSTWLEHGVGYYSLAFVANRALRRGAWGMVPPWLANGLIDELDIATYGTAYVGQESWNAQTPGWFRAGWSGFVPIGHSPPPPVTGPPANLAVTVTKTGNPWLDFEASSNRHWDELVQDLKTEAPASFTRSAENESFLPRDRAAGRCLMHLLITVGAQDDALFTALLDREVSTPRHGMPDSEPLPVLFAQALGGVPEVDRLEALDSESLLAELGRPDLIALFDQHDAHDALALRDHREQSLWLSRRAYDAKTRGALFNAFLEVEFEQQLAEWKAISPKLDAALVSALSVTKRYPRRERDMTKVVEAFWTGMAQATVAAETSDSRSSRKRSSRSRR